MAFAKSQFLSADKALFCQEYFFDSRQKQYFVECFFPLAKDLFATQ
jgi:hypothetical protein